MGSKHCPVMGSSRITQFKLLVQKNFVLSIKRKPVGYTCQLLWPTFIALLLLYLRGLFIPRMMEGGLRWPHHEIIAWPAGLDVPSNSSNEFVLMYSPKNAKTDELMNDVLTQLNTDTIKWYSFERYLMEKAIYEPLLLPDELTADEINETMLAFVPWYKFRDAEKNNYKFNLDPPSCRRKRNCVQVQTPKTKAEQKEWIQTTLISNIKGRIWDHRSRQMRIGTFWKMAKGLACGTAGHNPSARSVMFDEHDYDAFNDKELAYLSKKFRALGDRGLAQAENGISGRSAASANLTAFCGAANNMDEMASFIHEHYPVVNVTKLGFDSFADIEKMIINEKDEDVDTLQRILGAVDIENTNAEFATGFPDDFKYALRMRPSRWNYATGGSERFKRRRNRNRKRTGVEWKTGRLKVPLQLNFPRAAVPRCSSYNPGYFYEGFSTLQDAIDRAYSK